MTRSRVPAAVSACILLLASCGAPTTDVSPELAAALEGEIREAAESYLAALNAHDAEVVMSHYVTDESVLQISCSELRLGHEFISSRAGPFHTQYPEMVFDMGVIHVRVLGPGSGLAVLRGTLPIDGVTITLAYETDGAGRWLIAHEHRAWPECPPPVTPHPGGDPSELADSIIPEEDEIEARPDSLAGAAGER
jgi:uncharacterized protein (TIGR02246 family)